VALVTTAWTALGDHAGNVFLHAAILMVPCAVLEHSLLEEPPSMLMAVQDMDAASKRAYNLEISLPFSPSTVPCQQVE
jgi:hypothetical protein